MLKIRPQIHNQRLCRHCHCPPCDFEDVSQPREQEGPGDTRGQHKINFFFIRCHYSFCNLAYSAFRKIHIWSSRWSSDLGRSLNPQVSSVRDACPSSWFLLSNIQPNWLEWNGTEPSAGRNIITKSVLFMESIWQLYDKVVWETDRIVPNNKVMTGRGWRVKLKFSPGQHDYP